MTVRVIDLAKLARSVAHFYVDGEYFFTVEKIPSEIAEKEVKYFDSCEDMYGAELHIATK